ncbi:transposase family protein [Thermopolyspora sp. NPDC052614]|uniref:transposase family protein n=1 Tax=Thermopolyspora sp. NPDC052614 TaxID=3155682 RepID=UPI003434C111
MSCRAAIPLSNRTLTRLAELLRARRAERRSRWRRLTPGRQALPVLAHLRNGGTTPAWRYVHEAAELTTANATASRLPYVIADGTLIPIDRLADERPCYSGKHHRHGVNVEVRADPAGRLPQVSPALPGAAHDLAAAPTCGLKAWKVLVKLRCCPRRATALVQAVFVLQTIEEDRYSG